MNRLKNEWRRHYAVGEDGGLVGEGGVVRAAVIELGRPADWGQLAPLWQGVQIDLDWPAPGISVNGKDAYQLWFSLPRAVPADQAQALMRELMRRFLPEVPPSRLACWPQVKDGQVEHAPAVPRAMLGGERWSAFVAPDLAAVFGDEAALDLPPGDEAQADQLARLSTIPAQALAALPWPPQVQDTVVRPVQAQTDSACSLRPAPMYGFQDPHQFLLAVMNDPSVDMAQRIEAAKVLLMAKQP